MVREVHIQESSSIGETHIVMYTITRFMCRSDTNCEVVPLYLKYERWYQLEKNQTRQWIDDLPIDPSRPSGWTRMAVDNLR